MKKQIFATVCSIAFSTIAFSQSEFLERQAEKAKNKAVNRVENKIDKGMDKTLDKTEEGIEESVKGSKKEDKKDKKDKKNEEQNSDSNNPSNSSKNEESKQSSSTTSKSSSTNPQLKTYSKFDFVQGEKIIGYEDFNETSLGDFPLGWNTNASAQISKLGNDETKWLQILQDGYFMPEFIKELPENFTIEFDIYTRNASSNVLKYGISISALDNPRKDISTSTYDSKAGFELNWTGCGSNGSFNVYEKREVTNSNDNITISPFECSGSDNEIGARSHVAIWRQKNRLRIYVDENKIIDIPYGLPVEFNYNSFRFTSQYMDYATRDEKDEFLVANIRYAVGAPDTRSKLITEGKLVSRGILFNVNSDVIKPESYGTLKEISKVLIDNPDVKIKIIGHTDSDGDDATNLSLSKKRAESVKDALNKEFGIAVSRIETDGKGESEPSEPNTTALGKVNNRRVEFIKL